MTVAEARGSGERQQAVSVVLSNDSDDGDDGDVNDNLALQIVLAEFELVSAFTDLHDEGNPMMKEDLTARRARTSRTRPSRGGAITDL